MRTSIFVVLFLTASSVVHADLVTIMGSGAKVSCGVWLDSRQDHTDRLSNTYGLLGWALGYISGAAIYGDIGNPLSRTDDKGITYWLDNFCMSHPTTQFSNAVRAFISEQK